MIRRRTRSAFVRSEPLEARTLLAAIYWDGGAGDGLWNNPLNWSNDQVPTSIDEVTIEGSGEFTVLLSGAAATVATLEIGTGLNLTQPSLVIESKLTVEFHAQTYHSTTVELHSGGEINTGFGFNVAGRMEWTGGIISGLGGLTVDGTRGMEITGPDPKYVRTRVDCSAPTIWNDGDIICDGGSLSASDVFTMYGGHAIRSVGVGGGFSNRGTLHQLGGETLVEGTFSNAFHARRLIVDGTLRVVGSTINLHADMELNGTIVASTNYGYATGGPKWGGAGRLILLKGFHEFWCDFNTVAVEIRNPGTQVDLRQKTNFGVLEARDFGVARFEQAFTADSLRLVNGGTVTMNPGGLTVRTSDLFVDFGSRFDLADGALIVDYDGASPLPLIQLLLFAGYGVGSWQGYGISSSTAAALAGHALGYAESAALFGTFPAVFAGQPVDNSCVLIRYARYGDANLDGAVDLVDFSRLASGFGQSDLWSSGNFNYDNSVTLRDFNLLAANFGLATDAETIATP